MRRYQRLYAIEREAKHLSDDQRLAYRQPHAVPVWDELLAWAERLQKEGVAHAGTHDALAYLPMHAEGLRHYCNDGRVPISNMRAEHVAKTIAIARMNFLFAATGAGAEASGRIFSLIETASANGHRRAALPDRNPGRAAQCHHSRANSDTATLAVDSGTGRPALRRLSQALAGITRYPTLRSRVVWIA